ncbi:hypothetical protein CTheo_5342 [Ceratobasidium theobromae]|uniref:CHAT domain-containing protein n=1 Tax=Ceratobasidium theobromae TaxID=1582974 RepID=A0A5N5QHK8_9AGAM|nr:hypothetical protein CTheo_5342 [Ceratobasidium theobromae]
MDPGGPRNGSGANMRQVGGLGAPGSVSLNDGGNGEIVAQGLEPEAGELWRNRFVEKWSRLAEIMRSGGVDLEAVESIATEIVSQLEQDEAGTPENRPSSMMALKNISDIFEPLFQQFGKPIWLDITIRCQSRAEMLTPEEYQDKIGWLNNLGISHFYRFQLLGDLDNLRKAIECYTRAIALSPQDVLTLTSLLLNLGNAHLRIFDINGELSDLDKAVECHTQAVERASKGQPNMPDLLNGLGNAYGKRFERLGQLDDIEQAIKHHSQAVALADTPRDNLNLPGWLNNLGSSLLSRFERLGKMEDINEAIKILARAISLTPPGQLNRSSWLFNLGDSHRRRFERTGHLDDIEKAVEYLSQAVSSTPQDHPSMPGRFNSLGNSYMVRFEHTGKLEDIDNSIKYLHQAVSFTPPGHADMPIYLGNLGNAHMRRFERLARSDDIDKAIEYHNRAVLLTPKGHSKLPYKLNDLGNAHRFRFLHLKTVEDINKGITYQTEAVSLIPAGHASAPYMLNNLGNSHIDRFIHLRRPEDVNMAIECCTQAISLTPEGHADMPHLLNNLGKSYRCRFELLSKQEDIDQAIQRQAHAVLLTPEGHARLPAQLVDLGDSYRLRLQIFGQRKDFEGALESYRKCARLPMGNPTHRFRAARLWAIMLGPVSNATSERMGAYRTAIEFLPQLIWLGDTLDQRYQDVQKIGEVILEAAAFAIGTGEQASALEWLEQGRSIVWNQTLQLRTPLKDLSSVDSSLAEILRQASYELHRASSHTYTSIAESLRTSDDHSLELVAQQHRRLAERYESLLEEVRLKPGFADFLCPKRASELVCAARTGPVVVVNVHPTRCDALILQPGKSEIAHILLPEFSFAKAVIARDQLEQSLRLRNVRERGFRRVESTGGKDIFAAVLAALWTGVTKPVIDMLGYTPDADDLPHITWCTTGPLSFLPLHAAGNYDLPRTRLSDFAVSSYTPTLSALLSAAQFSSDAQYGLLAVGQESTPGQSPLPETVAELACIKNHAHTPISYTQIDGTSATREAVLEAMGQHNWVHLACHAHQNVADPTESGLFLYDGTLSLEMIAQKSFTNKGLAFLSACQTATGDKDLADEAVHLASGMLMAGYPSVIATMWSIADVDAPLVAECVYAQLLGDGKMDHKDAAKALHFATATLRAGVGEQAFERWVPYIHIGV